MQKPTAFDQFAPTILAVYHRNKEAFWAAVMAPFLDSQSSLLDWWHHLKVDISLLSAFQGLEAEAKQILRDFSAPLGIDVTRWKSNRVQYFKDAYPVFAFLAVWMDEEGLTDLIGCFGDILRAGVFAVAGYGILDANVDANTSSPVEILTAQALIAEYETQVMHIFGITEANLQILHQMRSLYLGAEIKEKSLRHIASPYSLERPEDGGIKGANAVTPFMLSLERLGRASQISLYWRVFLLFGAAIQVIDDWEDLEGDLGIGHYSYVTLGYKGPIDLKDAKRAAMLLRMNKEHIQYTYERSKDMIAQSRSILSQLEDRFLVRLVDVTELRLDNFFRKLAR